MRNATSVTHTAIVRGAVYKNDEAIVRYFTGMDHEELFDLKADMGKRWCELYFMANGFDQGEAVGMWAEQEIMQLWNNEWRRLDHYMVVPVIHQIDGDHKLYYQDVHLTVFEEESPARLYLEMGMMRALKRIYSRASLEKIGIA